MLCSDGVVRQLKRISQTARFDLTTGKLIQNSVVLIGDTGNVSGVGTLNTHTIPGGTDTFTLNAATQTLTNKSINGSSNTITNVSLTAGVTGILPVANGGTGLSSLASGIATWWATPSSANLAAVVTNETGSGQVVFNTQPTLDKPVLTSYVFSALPTPATNMLAIVTDCANTACSSGGGSTVRFMRYNGSAWAVLGDGDSGGTPAFSSITAGTNTAALLIGTGGSLGVTVSGTIAATSVTGLCVS